jgi:hypothetical protein
MTNNTLKQYCQIFGIAHPFSKTAKMLHERHVQNNNNNKNNETKHYVQRHYKSMKLYTTTFWVSIWLIVYSIPL